MTEDEVLKLESIANRMRGMTCDRRIPDDARDVLMASAMEVESMIEKYID